MAPWALLGPWNLTCGQETPRAAARLASEAVQNRRPGPGGGGSPAAVLCPEKDDKDRLMVKYTASIHCVSKLHPSPF